MKSLPSLLLFAFTALAIVACSDGNVSSRTVAETPRACAPVAGDVPLGIGPSEATKIALPEKQKLWTDECWMFHTAVARPAAPRDRAYTPPFETPVPYRTGIISGGNARGPFSPSNQWNGYLDGEKVIVRAGMNLRDRSGVIQIERYGDGNDIWLMTPAGSGRLEITNVEGETVLLVEAGGRPLSLEMTTGILTDDSQSIVGGTATSVTP